MTRRAWLQPYRHWISEKTGRLDLELESASDTEDEDDSDFEPDDE